MWAFQFYFSSKITPRKLTSLPFSITTPSMAILTFIYKQIPHFSYFLSYTFCNLYIHINNILMQLTLQQGYQCAAFVANRTISLWYKTMLIMLLKDTE